MINALISSKTFYNLTLSQRVIYLINQQQPARQVILIKEFINVGKFFVCNVTSATDLSWAELGLCDAK